MQGKCIYISIRTIDSFIRWERVFRAQAAERPLRLRRRYLSAAHHEYLPVAVGAPAACRGRPRSAGGHRTDGQTAGCKPRTRDPAELPGGSPDPLWFRLGSSVTLLLRLE